ncbi:MAG: SDR family oxidoreductase [Hyphomicrobiales bacterium]|nr:SDR family oxidoreductase [Hyphomicrobiales bacterium]MDE2114636.1 SDR family oxidoreductase [Hyphomicrobiales bacterium]
MSKRLNGKTAIITGAASGIGLACAQRFAAEGANVVLADVDDARGKAATREIVGHGFNAQYLHTDVSQRQDLASLIEGTVRHFGQLDILISNAGIAKTIPFLEISDEEFERTLAVNLNSAFIGGQLAARQMVAQGGGGVIINMSSVNALLAIPGLVAYAVSKGGINQLTKVMALELAPHRIRVNAIGPGTILTELARSAVMENEAARKKVLSRTPMGRGGEPSEIASVALFLASEDSSYITGQTIYPDGGRLMLNYTVPVDTP